MGLWNLKRPAPGVRQDPLWKDRDINTPTKLSTPNCSYLKEMHKQNWSRTEEMIDQDMSNLGSIPCAGNKPWHYYWYHVVLADRSLAWLFSERFYQQLTETNADTYGQTTGLRLGTPMEDLVEGLKEVNDMVTPQKERQYQLTQTSQRSQRLSHQLKSKPGLVHGPQHICSTGWPCLVSLGEDVPNPVKNW